MSIRENLVGAVLKAGRRIDRDDDLLFHGVFCCCRLSFACRDVHRCLPSTTCRSVGRFSSLTQSVLKRDS